MNTTNNWCITEKKDHREKALKALERAKEVEKIKAERKKQAKNT